MTKSFSTVKKLLGAFSDTCGQLLFGSSKIIKKYEDRVNLYKFFDKKIEWTTLLYRASQNDFEAEKFLENCQDVTNTLVVCKTEYGKVIGGYTPLCWRRTGRQEYYGEHNKEIFVFSLTNNDKFFLQYNCYAMKSAPGLGPTFGNTSGLDLTICDKANTVRNSGANVNSAFRNDKYVKGNPFYWEKFSGSKEENFLVQEW